MVSKVLAGGIAIALAAVAILAVPAARHLREQPPPSPPPLRLSLSAPPGAELGSGDETLDAAISPDERHIVFVATSNGITALWRRALDSEQAERIAGTEGARLPAWKHSGNVISFFAGDRLKQVSLADGTVRDLTTAHEALGASWLPDGSLLYANNPRDVIRRLQNGTMSDATKMRDGDRGHAFPMAAGSDASFVYTAFVADGGRAVRLVDDNGERELATTSGHGQLVGDTLLYVRDGVLLAQRLAPDTRQLSGRAVPIALDVGIDLNGHNYFTASPRAVITTPGVDRLHRLTWFPLAGGEHTPMREPGNYWQVRLSPDDGFAALTHTTPLLRTLDVVLVPISATGFTEQLSRAVAPDSDPVWSSDGRRLVFRSLQDGPPRLYTHAAHVGDEDVIVPLSTADETPTDWRDERIIVHAPGPKGDLDLWTVNERSGARDTIANTPFNETDGRLSPNGRWLAYVSDESGQSDIYAKPWPRGARVRISFAGGRRPRWSRDGRAVFFLRGTQIMQADLSASGFTTPRALLDVGSIRDFDVAHRRDAVLALVAVGGSADATARVIVDWRSLLK